MTLIHIDSSLTQNEANFRFGNSYCNVQYNTQEEIDDYIFNHEQYFHLFLNKLVPIKRSFMCRIGLHKLRTNNRKNGGGHVLVWGYCTRCNGAFTKGYANGEIDTLYKSHE